MTAVDEALGRVVERRAERETLRRKLDAAELQAVETDGRVKETLSLLAEEERDVAKLESFSPTRIWAALKGDRQIDLDRETAERDGARYRAAEAQARHDALKRDIAAYHAQLTEYDDVDQEYAAVLEEKEVLLLEAPGPHTRRLVEIAERRGTLQARDKELAEAHGAGVDAVQWLTTAEHKFGAARSWSNWDSFGGGGMFTDMMKYDRMDEANAALQQCNRVLAVLTRELSDLGVSGIAGVELDGVTRGLDFWFDNIFSDMSVRNRIVAAHDHVVQVRAWALDLVRTLAAEGSEVRAEVTALDAEREQLLTS